MTDSLIGFFLRPTSFRLSSLFKAQTYTALTEKLKEWNV